MIKLLSVGEVAAALQVKISTVYQYVNAGKLPCVKVGRRIRFKEEDIEAWIKSNSREVVA
ncbi:MAG: helix-turn-helix domain-containing protein [Spirochaetia bacterium]|nr:helix-turn-helix domain-containing protein [Spirochaetia bacterium]